jgi:hypothetical protein
MLFNLYVISICFMGRQASREVGRYFLQLRIERSAVKKRTEIETLLLINYSIFYMI